MLNTNIISVANSNETENLIILSRKDSLSWASKYLSTVEISVLEKQVKDEAAFVMLNSAARWVIVEFVSDKNDVSVRAELMRRNAGSRVSLLRTTKIESVTLLNEASENLGAAYVEGLVLGNYKFIKYFKQADKQTSFFKTLKVIENTVSAKELEELKTLLETVCIVRDLVNEPVITLDAVQLAKEIADLGKEAGFSSETFDKNKIEELGMGGLLSVNMGSQIPPTFNIMEWKPESAKNSKAIVLVGKGVVYDTGGLSLKPTPNSMDFMKCDMAGAAVVIGVLYLAAKLNLPLHIVGLVPATDNRPGENAYVPGDVIKMYSGSFVEVLNTDAEGRMILADALHYAKKYDPEFVFDFATLTGAAAVAIGPIASVIMGNVSDEIKNLVKNAGESSYERVVEFPLWDEYGDEIKSDIADLKNVGGAFGGAITAGKFLEHFTDYPWMHFDIAGVAFSQKESNYKVKGGTGYGIRLMHSFLNDYLKKF
jgi:leucyl aminopeptidase